MFHVVSCSRGSVHAWLAEPIYVLTYSLDYASVRCSFCLVSQESANYPTHESEYPLSVLRHGKEDEGLVRALRGTTRRRPSGARRFSLFQGCCALFSLTADS